MKIRIRYRRARVMVRCRKPGGCLACFKTGRVECHHYIYAYTTKEVRANPQLALKNSIWLCYTCHRIADMIRKMAADRQRVKIVLYALGEKAQEGANVRNNKIGANEGT